jgi:hypothetical protein
MLSDGRGVLVCEVGYQEREQERPQNRPSAKSCRRYPRNALEGQATNYAANTLLDRAYGKAPTFSTTDPFSQVKNLYPHGPKRAASPPALTTPSWLKRSPRGVICLPNGLRSG